MSITPEDEWRKAVESFRAPLECEDPEDIINAMRLIEKWTRSVGEIIDSNDLSMPANIAHRVSFLAGYFEGARRK